MAILLNKDAIAFARKFIDHHEVDTDADDWNECKPTPDEVLHYIDSHDMKEYGQWFLGKNSDVPDNLKEHFEYPLGDLHLVSKSALLASEKKANEKKHTEIAKAARELLDLIAKKMPKQ